MLNNFMCLLAILDKSLCDLPILIGLTSSNLKERRHIYTVGPALQTLSPLGGLPFQAPRLPLMGKCKCAMVTVQFVNLFHLG